MKKVLLVVPLSTTDWGTKNAGGVDSVCQMLIKQLTEQEQSDYHYRVVAFDPFSQVEVGREEVLSPYVEVIHYPLVERGHFLPIPGLLTQYYRIKQQIKSFQPDIVHTHLISWLIGVPNKYMRIATLHSYKKLGRKPVSFLNDLFYEKITPFLSQHFIDKYTGVGTEVIQHLKEDVDKPINKIGNPIDNSFFKTQKIRKTDIEELKLVTCCLLKRLKRVEKAIELAALLKQQGKKVTLNIIGPDSEKDYAEELRALVSKLQLDEEVSFLGRLNQQQIQQVYQQSNIAVYFSEEETFGLAPLEMMATGLPLFSSKVGVLEERAEEFKQLGVKYSDDITLDTDMIDLIGALRVSDTQDLVSYIKANFSVQSVVAEYERNYAEKVGC